MGTRQSIGGRSTFGLYAGLLAILALVALLGYGFFFVLPDIQRQREAEAQRAQRTATAEARQIEVERAYAAGVAFATAGDWERAAEEFGRAVGLDPAYKDVAARLAEARNKAEVRKATAASQSAATTTAQALSEIEAAYQRGLAYSNLKRWDQAKAEFEKVIAANPTYKDVQTRLADIETGLAEKTPVSSGNPTSSPVPIPTHAPATKVIDVSAAGEWQDVGINLIKGQSFEITATGLWSHDLYDTVVTPNPYGPNGSNKDDSSAIMPLVPIGALIGCIGNEAPFVVGERFKGVARATGPLRLGMNDATGTYSNNSGHIRVIIRIK